MEYSLLYMVLYKVWIKYQKLIINLKFQFVSFRAILKSVSETIPAVESSIWNSEKFDLYQSEWNSNSDWSELIQVRRWFQTDLTRTILKNINIKVKHIFYR